MEDTYMKLKNVILVCGALAAMIPAQAQMTEFALSSADSSKFMLLIDNMSYGAPQSNFTVKNLAPGMHRVQMATPGTGVGFGNYIMPETLYDGDVNIPDSSRVTAVSPQRGRLNIVSIVPILQYIYGIITGNGGNNNNGGIGTGNGGFPWGWPPINQGMNANDFEMLKASVRGKSFESAKLEICKQALYNNKVTSSQVAQLLDLMTFESTKLELAKFAYGRTVDKGNYYIVNNSFTFGSSISELGDYIRGGGF